MICSDGQALALEGFLNDPPPYCPCSYGEFPGVLERYVRDEAVLRLEEAVRKMTAFPAIRFGLLDRGVLRPGTWADLVVLDLARIRDRATPVRKVRPKVEGTGKVPLLLYPFENYPHQYPEGIDDVLVNGVLVIEEGEHTGALPGRVLRHHSAGGRIQPLDFL